MEVGSLLRLDDLVRVKWDQTTPHFVNLLPDHEVMRLKSHNL